MLRQSEDGRGRYRSRTHHAPRHFQTYQPPRACFEVLYRESNIGTAGVTAENAAQSKLRRFFSRRLQAALLAVLASPSQQQRQLIRQLAVFTACAITQRKPSDASTHQARLPARLCARLRPFHSGRLWKHPRPNQNAFEEATSASTYWTVVSYPC